MGFLREFWGELREFWKSQVFMGLVLGGLALVVQLVLGMIAPDQWESNAWVIVLPYGIILIVFLVGNIGRTIYLMEKRQRRSRLLQERQAERKKAIAQNAVTAPKPNLVCSKVEKSMMDFDSRSCHFRVPCGNQDWGLLLTVVNEIPDSADVAYVREVNAKLSYFNDLSPLQTVESGLWLEGRHHPDFGRGGINHLVFCYWEHYADGPVIFDVSTGSIARRSLKNATNLLLTLTSSAPIFKKRFHISLVGNGAICSDASCSFCKTFVLEGSGG
jgi:hypothetical protein